MPSSLDVVLEICSVHKHRLKIPYLLPFPTTSKVYSPRVVVQALQIYSQIPFNCSAISNNCQGDNHIQYKSFLSPSHLLSCQGVLWRLERTKRKGHQTAADSIKVENANEKLCNFQWHLEFDSLATQCFSQSIIFPIKSLWKRHWMILLVSSDKSRLSIL